MSWSAWGGDLTHLPAWVLNLDRQPERWAHIGQMLGGVFSQLHRVQGVDGHKLHLPTETRVTLRAKQLLQQGLRFGDKDIGTVGAIGATLSHVKAWRAALAAKNTLALFAEDDTDVDLSIMPRAKEHFRFHPEALAQLDNGPPTVWLINLSYIFPSAHRPLRHGWRQVTGFTGTVMYVASASALRIMAAKALPVDIHVDAYMSQLAAMGDIRLMQHPDFSTMTRSPMGGMDHGVITEHCGANSYTWPIDLLGHRRGSLPDDERFPTGELVIGGHTVTSSMMVVLILLLVVAVASAGAAFWAGMRRGRRQRR